MIAYQPRRQSKNSATNLTYYHILHAVPESKPSEGDRALSPMDNWTLWQPKKWRNSAGHTFPTYFPQGKRRSPATTSALSGNRSESHPLKVIIGGGSYDVSATKRGSQSVARSRNIQHPHMSDFKMLSQNMPFLFYIFSHIRKKRPHSSSQSAVPVVVRTVKDHVPTRCSTSICTDVTE